MIPVDQTETALGKGNCLAACVASILEIPVCDVPNFRLAENSWLALQDWLFLRGLYAVRVFAKQERIASLPGSYCIVTGGSPRNPVLHAVVGMWTDSGVVIAHDPHPDKTGIVGEPEVFTFFCKVT